MKASATHGVAKAGASSDRSAVVRESVGSRVTGNRVRPPRPSKVPVSQPHDAVELEAAALADRLEPSSTRRPEPRPSPVPYAPSSVWAALAGPVRPLPSSASAIALGLNPASVRIHAGDLANESSRALAADAFTVGDDIVLGEGYEPASDEGRHLIAHELVHVAQQRQRRRGPVVHRQGVTRAPVKPEPDVSVQKVSEQAEHVWTELLDLAYRGRDLDRANSRIYYYLERYDRAFDSFTDWLIEENEKAEAYDKWKEVMADIVVGIALGTAAGELWEAASIAGKLMHEAVVHSAEAGVVAGGERLVDWLEGPKPKFKAPPGVEADKVAREDLDKLVQAWRAHALLDDDALKFSPTRDALRKAAQAGVGKRVAGGAPKLDVAGLRATMVSLGELSTAIAHTDLALRRFSPASIRLSSIAAKRRSSRTSSSSGWRSAPPTPKRSSHRSTRPAWSCRSG